MIQWLDVHECVPIDEPTYVAGTQVGGFPYSPDLQMASPGLKDLPLSGWNKRWEEGNTGWHKTSVNPSLSKHFPALLERCAGANQKATDNQPQHGSIRVLVPLCGKTVDLMWLAEAGHRVAGVEFSEKAVKDFFTENHLPYKLEQVDKLVKYTCTDASKMIEIWQGDLFEVSSDNIGHFDAVWDRGSMVAVNVGDRERYVELILSLLGPKGVILMSSFDYNQEERSMQPFSIPEPMLQHLWGHACSLQLLETRDLLEENPDKYQKAWGLSRMEEVIYIIQKRS